LPPIRIPQLVGYLVAGVLVWPRNTHGLVGMPALPMSWTEIGRILLMFGGGLPFIA